MTTKTDYEEIVTFVNAFHSRRRGVLFSTEIRTILEALELKSRTTIELWNIRNMTVMYLSTRIESAKADMNVEEILSLKDLQSAITTVIDGVLNERGI